MMKKFHNSKKGQAVFSTLASTAIALVGFAIVLVVGFLIIAEGKSQVGSIEGIDQTNDTVCQTSIACNATNSLSEALSIMPDFASIIVIALVGAALIGIVALFSSR